MKLPWLKTTLLSLSLAACATPNQTYCDTDDMCPGDSICDVEAHRCTANPTPDAGDEDAGDEEVVPADASPTCDGAGQQCIAATPEGWSGPIAKAEAAAGDTTPSCDGEFSQDAGLFGSDIVESGSCDCECGRSTSLSCTSARLHEWLPNNTEASCENNVCPFTSESGIVCNGQSQPIAANSCPLVGGYMKDGAYLRAQLGQVTSGTCESPTASGELSSSFATQIRLCEPGQDALGCADGEICAPEPTEEFVDGLCIVREGEHDCPADLGYTDRVLLFASIDDSRACDSATCSCSVLTGSCPGKIEIFNDIFCRGTPVSTLERISFLESNMCDPLPSGDLAARYVVDQDGGSCTAGGQASIAGAAVGTGTQTLCCMP